MKKDTEGHVALYPRYIGAVKTRVLAYYEAETDELITEEEEHLPLPETFSSFVELLFTKNLLVFVGKLLCFPYLSDAIDHPRHTVYVSPPAGSRHGQPISCRLKNNHRETRWIVESDSAWCLPCDPELLTILRDTFTHVGVGACTTSGALGQYLMRKTWQDQYGDNWPAHRHPRPPMGCVQDILANRTGGRVDTPGMGKMFDMLLERDMKNAYASCFIRQPSGTPLRIWRDPGSRDGYVTFVCRVSVTIHRPLPLGAFPVRSRDERGELVPGYPRLPGTYSAYLWKEEIDDALQAGCTVETLDGWGWREWTFDTAPFVALMERLRDTAPSDTIAGIMKLCTVAGIGRLGMGESTYTLVGREQATEEEQFNPICLTTGNDGESLDWFLHAKKDRNYTGMPHWNDYTNMLCRHLLYLAMLPYAEQERLVASNYDAYILSGPFSEEELAWPEQNDYARTGDWRAHLLHSKPGKPPVPKPRHLDTIEKERFPGGRNATEQ